MDNLYTSYVLCLFDWHNQDLVISKQKGYILRSPSTDDQNQVVELIQSSVLRLRELESEYHFSTDGGVVGSTDTSSVFPLFLWSSWGWEWDVGCTVWKGMQSNRSSPSFPVGIDRNSLTLSTEKDPYRWSRKKSTTTSTWVPNHEAQR